MELDSIKSNEDINLKFIKCPIKPPESCWSCSSWHSQLIPIDDNLRLLYLFLHTRTRTRNIWEIGNRKDFFKWKTDEDILGTWETNPVPKKFKCSSSISFHKEGGTDYITASWQPNKNFDT